MLVTVDDVVPSVSSWLHNVLHLFPLEQLTHVLQGDMFVWGPVVWNMEEKNNAEIMGFCKLGDQVTSKDSESCV